MLRSLALLLIALPVAAGQTRGPRSMPAVPSPVDSTTEPPKVSDISFGSFEFQQPSFLHAGPGLFRIDGEPVIGARYVVEAYVDRDEAIASVRFEAVDENGSLIGPIAIARKPGYEGGSRFVGLMTVPTHPFRIVLSGEAVDGQPFKRVHRRLFRPVETAPRRPQPSPDFSPEEANLFLLMIQAIDEAGPQLIAEVEADLAASPAGRIVIPHMQVSNVTYASLLSMQGRPIGVRIAYDVTFSEQSQYNPEVQVEADYGQSRWQGLTRMDVLNSSITPMPREAYPPYGEVVLNEIRSSPLEAGARFTYEGGTVYHFTADLVPNYAVHNIDKSKSCIYYQQFRLSPDSQKAFAQILATETPTSYKVSIGRRAFTGSIPSFYGDGTFHKSFVAEGAQDCGAQPTRRF